MRTSHLRPLAAAAADWRKLLLELLVLFVAHLSWQPAKTRQLQSLDLLAAPESSCRQLATIRQLELLKVRLKTQPLVSLESTGTRHGTCSGASRIYC